MGGRRERRWYSGCNSRVGKVMARAQSGCDIRVGNVMARAQSGCDSRVEKRWVAQRWVHTPRAKKVEAVGGLKAKGTQQTPHNDQSGK